MIDRITKNEERLDSILLSIKKLDDALKEFNNNKKNIILINKYYGSKNWFKDKEAYETNKIEKIKAGVLGEDTVFDMNDDIGCLIHEMKKIINSYGKVN